MLQLDRDDLEAIHAVQQALLALPATPAQQRVRGILERLRRLVRARGAFAFYFFEGTPVFIADRIGEEVSEYLFAHWTGFDEDGYFRFSDPELEAVNRLRRSLGAGVHHEARLGAREAIERTRFFREAFEPAGMHHVIGLSTPLPVGEAVFAFGFEGDDDPGFRGERSEALLSLVLPAFSTGFRALHETGVDLETLLPALEALPCPAAIVTADGRAVAANAPMRAAEGRAEGAYRIPGPVLPGSVASEIVLAPGLATKELALDEAIASFGLTPRQGEVARLLVEGRSDREIAARLGISLHTARRHGEAVLDRLGVSSRAAVLLALLRGLAIRVR